MAGTTAPGIGERQRGIEYLVHVPSRGIAPRSQPILGPGEVSWVVNCGAASAPSACCGSASHWSVEHSAFQATAATAAGAAGAVAERRRTAACARPERRPRCTAPAGFEPGCFPLPLGVGDGEHPADSSFAPALRDGPAGRQRACSRGTYKARIAVLDSGSRLAVCGSTDSCRGLPSSQTSACRCRSPAAAALSGGRQIEPVVVSAGAELGQER